MKNKELKKKLIESGCFNDYRKQRFNYFENGEYNKIDSQLYFHLDSGEQMTPEEIQANAEMKECRKKQVSKIRDHITYWLQQGFVITFCTWSYEGEKEPTWDNLRAKAIKTMKQANCCDYIINVDYGKQNERLHGHSLTAFKKEDFEKLTSEKVKRNKGTQEHPIWRNGLKWHCGAFDNYENKIGWYDCELCTDDEESAKKLSRYIDKLTMHSLKVKQSYVSVMKGTDYQREKEFRKNTRELAQSLVRVNKKLSNERYLYILRQNKGIIDTEKWCEQEYKVLLNKEREKELKKAYIESVKRRKKKSSVFV